MEADGHWTDHDDVVHSSMTADGIMVDVLAKRYVEADAFNL